ncbi:MAG: hypothetical protein HC828_18980 [Blastochloris sp.]|nr:hypothetical protein [Blastochloris sp.]
MLRVGVILGAVLSGFFLSLNFSMLAFAHSTTNNVIAYTDELLYLLDIATAQAERLTSGDARDVSWSPDGTQLAFSSARAGSYDVYVIGIDGRGLRRLTSTSGNDHQPVWSPDGTQLAFYSDNENNRDIYVVDSDGSNPHRFTNHPADDVLPAWSPDGMALAFVSNRDGVRESILRILRELTFVGL